MKGLVRKFTKEQFIAIRDALQVLLDNKHDISVIPEPLAGLCLYVENINGIGVSPHYIGMFTHYFDSFFKSWKHYTGVNLFPIPNCNPELDEREQYYGADAETMWVSGRYAELRYDLAQHIVNCLNDLIGNYDKYKGK